VAEVFGTLPVVVRGDLDLIDVDLQLLGHHLRHLDEEPLPHLRAAVVQMQAAVSVDVQQRAGLVEVRGGEGDAELDRRQRDALLEVGVVAVKVTHRRPPRLVVGTLFQLGDDLLNDVVLDRHVVGGNVALTLAVEVGLAHLQGIDPQMQRDGVDHMLHSDHALRSAEAAERRVRHRVGLAAL